jgi:hypothetical protein
MKKSQGDETFENKIQGKNCLKDYLKEIQNASSSKIQFRKKKNNSIMKTALIIGSTLIGSNY